MWIFDRGGASALLLAATGRIFTPAGIQVGWLDGDALFTLDSHQVGWFSDGLLRDLEGAVAGFTRAATDDVPHPDLPEATIATGVLSLPVATVRPPFPPHGARAADRADWSAVDANGLFRALAETSR